MNQKDLRDIIIGIIVENEQIPEDELFNEDNKPKLQKARKMADEIIEAIKTLK